MKHANLFFLAMIFASASFASARIIRDEETNSLITTPAPEKKTATPSALVETKKTTLPKPSEKASETQTKKDKKSYKHKDKKNSALKTEKQLEVAPAPPAPPAAVSNPATDLLDAKIKQIKEDTEKEIASLQAQQEKKMVIIKRQEELKKLEEQQKAIAEELAKLDDKQKLAEPEKPKLEPVTTDWKVAETARFTQYTTELADTIAMGESDDLELQDFKKIFDDQKAWFDTTLTSTKYVTDPGYKAISDRNKILETLVAAQKKALPILMREINIKKISKNTFDRLTTLLLYNLNEQIIDPKGWNGKLPTDEAEFKKVIETAIAEAKDPSFGKQSPAQKELIALQKKLNETQKLIEERNKTVLELKMTIGSNTEHLEQLKKNVSEIETKKKESEAQLKQLQEKSTHDIDAFKAEKTKVEAQLTQAQSDAKDAKTKLDAATADSSKTAQEKTELQNQAKDLAKKVEDLQEKKSGIEKNLDEEQHKRRELELQIEQTKFKQDQTEQDRKKLSEENAKLDNVRKELSEQVENKNKQALELNLELERLRRELNTQSAKTHKKTSKALTAMRQDFEEQIHELKMIVLKQTPQAASEIAQEEAEFKAKAELEKQLEKEQIEDELPALPDIAILSPQQKPQESSSDKLPDVKDLTEQNKKALKEIELKNLAKRNKEGLTKLETKVLTDINKKGLSELEQKISSPPTPAAPQVGV